MVIVPGSRHLRIVNSLCHVGQRLGVYEHGALGLSRTLTPLSQHAEQGCGSYIHSDLESILCHREQCIAAALYHDLAFH